MEDEEQTDWCVSVVSLPGLVCGQLKLLISGGNETKYKIKQNWIKNELQTTICQRAECVLFCKMLNR